MTKNIIYFTLFIFLISCNKVIEPETPEKIFEKYKSSVVLIASQYYYEVHSGNSTYYYSPGTEKKLFFTKEEVLKALKSQ